MIYTLGFLFFMVVGYCFDRFGKTFKSSMIGVAIFLPAFIGFVESLAIALVAAIL